MSNIINSNFVMVNSSNRRNEEAANSRRSLRETSESVVSDPQELMEFATANSLSLQPKYLVIRRQNGGFSKLLVGLKGQEVWRYEVDSISKKLSRIGIEKQLSEQDRVKFESAILGSRLLIAIQPTNASERSDIDLSANKPAYSVLETSSALFNVQMNAKNEATISQIGLRSRK